MRLVRSTYAAALTICFGCCVLMQGCFNAEVLSDSIESGDGTGSNGLGSTSGGNSGAILSFSPATSHSFGKVAVSGNASWGFTITNVGTEMAVSMGSAALPAPFSFGGATGFPGLHGNCGSSLGPNQSCQVEVSFSPTSAGGFGTSFSVNYTDSQGSHGSNFSLDGTGSTPKAYLYVAAQLAGTATLQVKGFGIDRTTGALTPVTSAPLASNARGLAIDAKANRLFVAEESSNQVDALHIDPATGALTLIGSITSAGSYAVAVHPSLPILYSVEPLSSSIRVIQILADGTMSSIQTQAVCSGPAAVAVHPLGGWLYLSCSGAVIDRYRIDSVTGILNFTDSVPTGSANQAADLAMSSDGVFLFATDESTNSVRVFQTASGAFNSVSGYSLGGMHRAIAAHPFRPMVFAAGDSMGNVGSGLFDLSGVITVSNNQTDGMWPSPGGLKVDPTGNFLYSANNASSELAAFGINSTTGALSALATYNLGFQPWGLVTADLLP